jgi:hypothetical protein
MNTFVIKPIVYESIVPTDFRTHSFDYLNSADRTIPVVSRQHVWVDNCLYNSNLEECVEISDSYDILNVYGEYVVVKRRADNFLFFLQIDWQTYKVTELSYYCKLLEGHRIALCFNDWGTIENYDPIANRFLVDMDALEEERKRAQSRHFYDSYTVADAFDAMTSKRVYRDSLPIDVVISEIEKNKGTQFDPQVADAFLDILKNNYSTIREIQEKFIS